MFHCVPISRGFCSIFLALAYSLLLIVLFYSPASSPPPRPRAAQPGPPEKSAHAISTVQWYPHDTGLFTSSSTDHTLRVWDTNQLCVVEQFSFSHILYTHSLAASDQHSLIAGRGGRVSL